MKVVASPVRPGIGAFLPRIDAGVLRLRLHGRGRGLAEHHAVAGGAGDAVARQRRIVRECAHLVVGLERNGVQVVARERLAGAGRLRGGRWRTGAGLAPHGSRGRCPRWPAGIPDGRSRSRSRAAQRRSDRVRRGPSATCARCRRARGSTILLSGPGSVMSNCRPVPPALWQPRHSVDVTNCDRAFGLPAGAQTWS